MSNSKGIAEDIWKIRRALEIRKSAGWKGPNDDDLLTLLEENTALRSELDKKNIVLQKVPELVYAESPHTAAELCKIILDQYKT